MFLEDDRNRGLRTYILKQFVSSVMTDQERAAMWGLPKGCRMRENAKIISPENLECGEYVWIGEGVILDASGGLVIGSHTTIGSNAMIWSHTSVLANLAMENLMGSDLIKRSKTSIGSGCFIGGPSVVYRGVTIKDRTVVQPMSSVTEDTPGNCIVAGSPAKVIRIFDDAYIEDQINRARPSFG